MKPCDHAIGVTHNDKQSPRSWSCVFPFVTCLVGCAVVAYITVQPASFSAGVRGSLEGERVDLQHVMGLWSLPSSKIISYTGDNSSALEILQTASQQLSAFVIVTLGKQRPARRAEDQPFLSASPGVLLPVASLNAAAGVVEHARGTLLYPLRLETADFSRFPSSGPVRPYVIWEAGSGLVLVDEQLAALNWGRAEVTWAVTSLSDRLAFHISTTLKAAVTAASQQPFLQHLHAIMGPALAAAVAAAFVGAPPLWFCILCPTVLGLAAPLIVNLALNQVAGYLCTHLSLPDDQCFDLLLGALGLGFVLSLASAIPIFTVCRLFQCSHRDERQKAA